MIFSQFCKKHSDWIFTSSTWARRRHWLFVTRAPPFLRGDFKREAPFPQQGRLGPGNPWHGRGTGAGNPLRVRW
jgi:hypothetical protein